MSATPDPRPLPSDVPPDPPAAGMIVERGRYWGLAVGLLSTRPLSFEEERKRLLFGSLALVAIVMLVVFGAYHLMAGPPLEGAVDLGVAAALTLAVLAVRGKRDGTAVYRAAVLVIALLFVFFGTQADDGGRAFLVLTLPAFAFFVTGPRFGTAVSLGVFVAWMLFFTLPATPAGAFDYTAGFAGRFAASYLTILALALFMERVIYKYADTMRVHRESLERANLDLHGLATKDPLTGLLNRRSILTHLEDEAAKAARNGLPLTVALLDLDHFKKVNDTHGHLVGDEILVECSERIEVSLRSYDRVGRYGGEEFLLVLSGTTADDAGALLERVRRRVGSRPYRVDDLVVEVTASIGAATSESGVVDVASLIELADTGLYEAKEGGRNQVRIHDGTVTAEEPRLRTHRGPGAASTEDSPPPPE